MSNSREIMERSNNNARTILILEDGSELKDAILAVLTSDFAIGEPILIKCHDLPCEAISTYDLRQLQSFTPPHKKSRRDKFKRSGK